MSDDNAPAFLDADELGSPPDVDLASTLRSLVRSDLVSANAGAVLRAFSRATGDARIQFLFAWNDAMADADLADWIAADAGRRRRADELALHLVPDDRSTSENAAAVGALRSFSAWSACAYRLVIVPGYTRALCEGVRQERR
jgi:hypothetical protein